MCLATAYPNTEGDEPILQDIARMRFDDGRIEMETLFGQEKAVPGRVLEVDFVTSKVIVDLYHTSVVRSRPEKKPGVNTT